MAGPGPWPPGAGGSRWAEEALGIAAARRRPALAAFSAFSFIPPRREGPPELSYFNRAAKNMFSPMTPFLEYQKVTTSIFLAVTENMQKVMVSTLMRSAPYMVGKEVEGGRHCAQPGGLEESISP